MLVLGSFSVSREARFGEGLQANRNRTWASRIKNAARLQETCNHISRFEVHLDVSFEKFLGDVLHVHCQLLD